MNRAALEEKLRAQGRIDAEGNVVQLRKIPAQAVRAGPAPKPPAVQHGAGPAASDDRMNKTERRFVLEWILPRMASGEIVAWGREKITLTLADPKRQANGKTTKGRRYRPDFHVKYADGTVELIEVKGTYVRDDARDRFLIAVENFRCLFAFRWAVWHGKAKGWDDTESYEQSA